MEPRNRVFIIAGTRLLRDALTRILSNKSDIAVAGSGEMSGNVLLEIRKAQANVLLLDSVGAANSSPTFLRDVQLLKPPVKAVMIGVEDHEDAFLRAVRMGVSGFVLRDGTALDVVSAIRAAMQGEVACPAPLCRILLNHVARESAPIPNIRVRIQLGLTRREQQLVPLVAQGLRNKEIASQLNLSEQTVKNHIHRMLHKLGAMDRLEMVDICRHHGALI